MTRKNDLIKDSNRLFVGGKELIGNAAIDLLFDSFNRRGNVSVVSKDICHLLGIRVTAI